jgi:hypothetical protein
MGHTWSCFANKRGICALSAGQQRGSYYLHVCKGACREPDSLASVEASHFGGFATCAACVLEGSQVCCGFRWIDRGGSGLRLTCARCCAIETLAPPNISQPILCGCACGAAGGMKWSRPREAPAGFQGNHPVRLASTIGRFSYPFAAHCSICTARALPTSLREVLRSCYCCLCGIGGCR